jgi:hypothetical protein
METIMNTKLGHQSKWAVDDYNYINIEGLHHCDSHNFCYNPEDEELKLYNAKPCIYTDERYHLSKNNWSGHTYLYSGRFKPISLKSCIRRTLACRNIPVDTIVKFQHSWHTVGKKINTSYLFKVRKENIFEPNYQVTKGRYLNNFKECNRSQELVGALRANDFLVEVWNINPHILIGEEQGELAIAFGNGYKIGFSSQDNTFMGYGDGTDNILYTKGIDFDKWSRCNLINKQESIGNILEVLKKWN